MPAKGHIRGVRVKGWGKSPPRTWRQGRHGKPHREQDRIGMTRRRASAFRPVSGPVVRVGCERRRASGVPDEWLPRSGFPQGGFGAIQNPAYRPAGENFMIEGPSAIQRAGLSFQGAENIGHFCFFAAPRGRVRPVPDNHSLNLTAYKDLIGGGMPGHSFPLTPILSHGIPNIHHSRAIIRPLIAEKAWEPFGG